MVRQLIAMGTGMGIVPGGREGRFDLRVMGRVRIRMIHGVVMFLLIVAFFVLAGMRPGGDCSSSYSSFPGFFKGEPVKAYTFRCPGIDHFSDGENPSPV